MNKFISLYGLSTFLTECKNAFAAKSSLATVATSGSYSDLSNKPTIPSAYTLPTASSSTLGGVKIGTGLSISSGTVFVSSAYATKASPTFTGTVTAPTLTVTETLNIPGGKIYLS